MGIVRGHRKERAAECRGPQTPDVVAATAGTGRGDGGSVPSPRERLRSREMAVKIFVAGVTFVALFKVNRSAAVVGAMLAPVVSELVTDYVERHQWSVRRLRRGSAAVVVIGQEEKAYAARRRRGGAAGGGGGLPGALFAGLAAIALVGGGMLIWQHSGGGHTSAVGPTGPADTGSPKRPPGPPGHVIGLAGATPTAVPPFITWHAVAGAVRYDVWRNGRLVARPTTNSFRDRHAPNGSLTYRVTAMAHGVAGPPSTRHTVVYEAEAPPQTGTHRPPAGGPVDPPTGLTGSSPTPAEPELTWNPVHRAGEYTVYRGGTPVGHPAKPLFRDAKAEAGTSTYFVTVTVDGVESGHSGSIEVRFVPPLLPPSGLAGPGTFTYLPIVLTWYKVDGAQGYVVYRDGVPLPETRSTTLRDGDASLADHSYTVAAVNAIGAEGEQSAPVQVTYTPPPAVS